MSLLKAEGLGIQFGGLKAVDEFNFEMDKDQLYGLIGPNGAGKTTVFNLLTGVYKPTSGQILFDGKITFKDDTYANYTIRDCKNISKYSIVQKDECY